jgi:hypothetical protein
MPVAARVSLFLGAVVVALFCVAAGSPASAPCQLTLKSGARQTGPPGQYHLNLVFVDRGPTRCRLRGWPSIELIGPDDPSFGAIYVIPRRSGSSGNVVLSVGAAAHAALTWLPPSEGRPWVPGYLRAVVPTASGESLPMAVPWRFGPVLRQDAATHPGTFVGPVQPGRG